MYQVEIINDGNKTLVHSPHVNNLKLEEGSISKEINKIDSFSMSYFHNNPAYGNMKPLKTLVNVLNMKTNQYEFEGRVLAPTSTMENDGLHKYSWDCEGELGYLHDSQQRHLEFRGTPEELFIEILRYHNQQVEDYKHFEPGIVEVTTTTDNIYIYLSAESTTFEEIEDKILERVGGELRIRKENGVRYLDVLERVGGAKRTEIRIAKNLRSMTQSIDPTDIITRLTPLGERIESEDEEATDASQARLTIEEVNNGIPYIDREDLIEEFGIQGGEMVWDDITLPDRLLSTAGRWMDSQEVARTQYDISALDLFLIGLDIDYFDVGNSYPVINPVMGIDEELRIISKTTNINKPQDASLKIGDKFLNLSDYQATANKSARRVADLEQVVNRQSERMAVIQKEMNNVDDILDEINRNIGDADIPALEESINNLNQAVSDLIDAVDSIPDYDPATPDMDGLMSAADKAKLDLIQVINSIDLDGLKQKLDLITVGNPIDLNDLEQRVRDLEKDEGDPTGGTV